MAQEAKLWYDYIIMVRSGNATLECSDGSMFHPLSYVAWKNPFCCAETARNSPLNRRRIVVFDRLWAKAVPITNRTFSCSKCSSKMANTMSSDIFKEVFYPSRSEISMFLNRCGKKTFQYFYSQFFVSYSTEYGQWKFFILLKKSLKI